jgi:hypothetical protein
MTLDKVFCNIPWFEVHINADGTYHSCGAQPNTISSDPDLAGKYNVHAMTIPEWINSEFQCRTRLHKLNGVAESVCNMCYYEESVGSSSKRVKENLKSKISHNNFVTSYQHSPDLKYFDYSKMNHGRTDFAEPNSYHISLGNECNLACKHCSPMFSSKLAAQMSRAGEWTGSIRQNWTTDDSAWNHVADTICQTKNLKFVHLIGGEPLLNPRFEDLIDRLIAANQTDIYIGFTTNGTVFSAELLQKLSVFRHVDVGVSIECGGLLNSFVRQGVDTQQVLDNIDQYLKYQSPSHFYVTVRPVPSALTVHTIDQLFYWCIDRQVDLLTNILVRPAYMQIKQLPAEVKQRLLEKFELWIYGPAAPSHSDPRDPTYYRAHIDNEVRAIIQALKQENDPALTATLYQNLQSWGWFDNPEIKKYFFI